MIPFTVSPRLIAYGLAGAAIVGALLWVGLTVNGWRTAAARVPALESTIADREATIKQIRRDIETAAKASEGYQNELRSLRTAAAVQPTPIVRLCRPAAAARVSLPAAESRPDGASGAGGQLPPGDAEDRQPGPDIGPALFALADRADECAAQLRGLQGFVTSIAGR